MADVIKNNRRIQLLCFGLAGIIFLLDIKLPLGIAGGVPYVLVVLLSWSYPKSFTFKIAWLCSFLTIIGLFLSPPGSELWIVLINRSLALFVIWATAIITHQYKRSEVALEKKKEKEQKYLDIAGEMFVALDANGNVTQINKMGCDIVGYPEAEIIGKNWFDLGVPERTRAEIKTIFARVMAGETVEYKYFDNPVVTRNGEEKLLSWQNTVLRDENDRIIGSLSSGLDITERKKTSKSLKESEERFRSLIRSIDDMIYTLDCEQKYTGVFGGWGLKNGFT